MFRKLVQNGVQNKTKISGRCNCILLHQILEKIIQVRQNLVEQLYKYKLKGDNVTNIEKNNSYTKSVRNKLHKYLWNF